MKKDILLKAVEIVKSLDHAAIAAIDDEGFPRASAISSIKVDGLHTLWFSTGLKSGKVRCLKQNNKASLCYHDNDNNITLIGTVEILTDRVIKKELWVDWFIEHFPEGPTDPNYCILKFITEKGALWVDNVSLEFDKSELQ